jgi:hypothetical protein
MTCTPATEITMQIGFPFVGTVWRTDRIEAEGRDQSADPRLHGHAD